MSENTNNGSSGCNGQLIDQSQIIEIEDTDNELDDDSHTFLSAPKILKQNTTHNNKITPNQQQSKFIEQDVTGLSRLEFRSIQRVCNFFRVQIKHEKSLQEIKRLLRKKIIEKNAVDYQRPFSVSRKCPIRAIHITNLPHWFQNFHVKTLISLMSDFDVNNLNYYIDMFKDGQNKNTGECLIRFQRLYDCMQVFYDLQGLHAINKAIKVESDEGNTLSTLRDRRDPKNFKKNQKLRNLRVVLNEHIKKFKQELIQMQLIWNGNESGFIDLEDMDEENDVESTKSGKTYTSLKIYDGSEKSVQIVEENSFINTSEGDPKPDYNSDTHINISEDIQNDDNNDDVFDEVGSSEKEEFIFENGLFFEDTEGASVNENDSRTVSIDFAPKTDGNVFIKKLIKSETGRDNVEYVFRKVRENNNNTGKYLLKFRTHEDALEVCEKLNGIILRNEKLEVKLVLDNNEFWGENSSYINYVAKRKMITNNNSNKSFWSAKRKKIATLQHKSGHDVTLANEPSEERTYDTYGLSKDLLNRLEIKPPLSTTIVVNNLHPDVDEAKLMEVFSLAGRVKNINKNNLDSEEQSAKIEFDHPVEAVQAISMFHNQKLYDKNLLVKMDTIQESSLPSGLSSIGKGLGRNGEPLKEVRSVIDARNIYDTLVEIGAMVKSLSLDEEKSFEHNYVKRKVVVNNMQDEKNNNVRVKTNSCNIASNSSKSTATNSSGNSRKVGDVAAIKKLCDTLASRGVIPPGSHCEDLESVLRLLLNSSNVATNPSISAAANFSGDDATVKKLCETLASRGVIPPRAHCEDLKSVLRLLKIKPSPCLNSVNKPNERNLDSNSNTKADSRLRAVNVQNLQYPDREPENQNHDLNSRSWYSNTWPAESQNVPQTSPDFMSMRETGPFCAPSNIDFGQPQNVPLTSPDFMSMREPGPFRAPSNMDFRQTIESAPGPSVHNYGLFEQNGVCVPNMNQSANLNRLDTGNEMDQAALLYEDPPYLNRNPYSAPNPPSNNEQTALLSQNVSVTNYQNDPNNARIMELNQSLVTNLEKAPVRPTNSHKKISRLGCNFFNETPKQPNSQEKQSQKKCDDFREMTMQTDNPEKQQQQIKCERSDYDLEQPEYSQYHNNANVSQRTNVNKQPDMLIFKNLPRNVSGEVLANKLSEVGDVLFCVLTGAGRAVVRFSDAQDADRCLKLFNRSKVDNQVIEVTIM